jgi:hypothetical protein
MPMCPIHNQLYGEGCTCYKCDAIAKQKKSGTVQNSSVPGTRRVIR